ncbi:Bax inhibitor-1/YccA family protein [Deinococcus psychrotolerans]|uniref:Bax inhibitor-1/YccA family protein n=1 Tax=Deinococcus psychrotolerans TaxID=2489213 RepID=A0A3G8YIT7_9DEIO|nr:Bax inhibitor-1/YccA family protein [Deinococcus psychrotolerans]AZI41341.1 Bax inhibitor-1/YccA family protein [Deinococcus psychrotolerans]
MQMTATRTESVVRSFMNRTYSWMAAGLVLTAAIAYITASNQELAYQVLSIRFPLLIVQLGVVFGMSFLLPRINAAVAGILFMVYAAITGLTFSGLLMVYSTQAVYSAFGTAALTFGAMSVLGYVIKRDLSGMGRFFLFALIGLVVAMVVNIWIGGTVLNLMISGVGVLLFAGLTVYDTQRLRNIALSGVEGDNAEKGAIYGALSLYLNFINMFLFLLRIFSGGGRN